MSGTGSLMNYKKLYHEIKHFEDSNIKYLEEKSDTNLEIYYDELTDLRDQYYEIRQTFHSEFNDFRKDVKTLQKNSDTSSELDRKLIKKMELINKDFHVTWNGINEKNEKEFLIHSTIQNTEIEKELIKLKNKIKLEELKFDKASVEKINEFVEKKKNLDKKLLDNHNIKLKFQFLKNHDIDGFEKELEKQETEKKEKIEKEKKYQEQVKKESEKRKENSGKGNSDKGKSDKGKSDNGNSDNGKSDKGKSDKGNSGKGNSGGKGNS